MNEPILYSFRRCPFAIRARMALYFSKIRVELREISLKDKPYEMIKASKKSTVPILVYNDLLLDESINIILWALKVKDDYQILRPYQEDKSFVLGLIKIYDNIFKYHLDRYKYSTRYFNNKDFLGKYKHRELATLQLENLENILEEANSIFIYKNKLSILDICIFPLVRQFRIADKKWFDEQFSSSLLIKWLKNIEEQDYFKDIMIKYSEWKKTKSINYFSFEDVKKVNK